jgi:hypothetical protein
MSHRRISVSASVAFNTPTEAPTLAEFEQLQEAFRDVFKHLCPGACVSLDLSLGIEDTAFTRQSVFTVGIKDLKPTLVEEVACQVSQESTEIIKPKTVSNAPEESNFTIGQSIPIHPDVMPSPAVTVSPDYGQPIIAVPEHNPHENSATENQLRIMEAIARIREIGNMLDQMRPMMEAIPGIRNEINELNTELLKGFRNG